MTQTERIAALQRTVEIQREQIEALAEQVRQLQERLTAKEGGT
jgi:polyhydroxyalkanoate synthesis regulator phasin